MKVGGPLRGYNRAKRISLVCCVRYFLVGAPLTLVAGPILAGSSEPVQFTAGLFFGLFYISTLMFPSVLAANLVFVRLFRGRTWRNERWRPWTAGAFGIVLTGVGMILVEASGPRPPRFIQDLCGESAAVLYAMGWFVLFSNLALLAAWGLPPRGAKGGRLP